MTDNVIRMEPTPPDYIRKKSGEIQPVLANVATLLRANSRSWDLGYDEFSDRLYKGDEPLQDKHFLELTEWVQQAGILAGLDVVTTAAIRVAHARAFHQVRDYLVGLTWDQTPRIDTMLTTYAGVTDAPLARAMSAKWMIQAVARVMQPGCQADSTLVFEGPQGVGKSSFFRLLFSEKWFTDHLPDLSSKDALIQLRGVWCVEIAELASFTKHDAKRINQFLTSQTDTYRAPYGRVTTQYPRQTVFSGTVNPGANGYLKDETGARRFWTVTTGDMALHRLIDDRDQLWAEAAARYGEGELWYMNNAAMDAEARETSRDRLSASVWQDAIDAFLATRDNVSQEEIFSECLFITAVGDRKQSDMNAISACLAHAGWERHREPKRDQHGLRKWRYRPAKASRSQSDGEFSADWDANRDAENSQNNNDLL